MPALRSAGEPARAGGHAVRKAVARRSVVALAIGLALAFVPRAGAQNAELEDAARQNAVIVATLIRTTLVALGQANETGNYTVLRDLAAPSFRDANSAADLAVIFEPLRKAGVELDGAVVLEPKLTSAPSLDERGLLAIEGTLATAPQPVTFQLLFQAVDGAWRLFGLSVNPSPPVAAVEAAPGPDAPAVPFAGEVSLDPRIPRVRPALRDVLPLQ